MSTLRYKVSIIVPCDKIAEVKRTVYQVLHIEQCGFGKVKIIAEVTQFMEMMLKWSFGEDNVKRI